jgi:hypothetical protein
MPRHAILAAVVFVTTQLTSAPAQATPVTYDYVGNFFNFCGYGCPDQPDIDGNVNAPSNWASDRILASLTFSEALPANMLFQDMLSSPTLLSWSIGDALGFFSLSSATGGLTVPTEFFPSPLMLSTDANGNIANYVMVSALDEADPTIRTEIGIINPPLLCLAEECGQDLYLTDFLTPDLYGPAEWDAFVFSPSPAGLPGQWTRSTSVPEPASLTLTLFGLAGAIVNQRRLSRRRSR